MNISISKITNGWVVTVASPQGQSAIYCKDYDEVLQQLTELKGQTPV